MPKKSPAASLPKVFTASRKRSGADKMRASILPTAGIGGTTSGGYANESTCHSASMASAAMQLFFIEDFFIGNFSADRRRIKID